MGQNLSNFGEKMMKVEIEKDKFMFFVRVNDVTVAYINRTAVNGKKYMMVCPKMLKEQNLGLSITKEPDKINECPYCGRKEK